MLFRRLNLWWGQNSLVMPEPQFTCGKRYLNHSSRMLSVVVSTEHGAGVSCSTRWYGTWGNIPGIWWACRDTKRPRTRSPCMEAPWGRGWGRLWALNSVTCRKHKDRGHCHAADHRPHGGTSPEGQVENLVTLHQLQTEKAQKYRSQADRN